MKRFGLIGNPLTHSFSKRYFEEKFKREQIDGCSYDLFELKTINELPDLLNTTRGLAGLNVTIPYKQTVIPFLNSLSAEAQAIGAVNCIKIENGKLTGYNTDAYGFETSLKKVLTNHLPQTFVLGTGGSARAVQYVLQKLGIAYHVVSRTERPNTISYTRIDALMQQHNLFINTTPVGMFPQTEACPAIPYHKLGSGDVLFDLIYNPDETGFLKKGKQQGATVKNGLEMLELQAEKSWEIWNTPSI